MSAGTTLCSKCWCLAQRMIWLVSRILYLIFIWPIVLIRQVINSIYNVVLSTLKTTVKLGVIFSVLLSILGILILAIVSIFFVSVSQEVIGYIFIHLTAAVYALLYKIMWFSCFVLAIYYVSKW